MRQANTRVESKASFSSSDFCNPFPGAADDFGESDLSFFSWVLLEEDYSSYLGWKS
jgi:hypothetical protein